MSNKNSRTYRFFHAVSYKTVTAGGVVAVGTIDAGAGLIDGAIAGYKDASAPAPVEITRQVAGEFLPAS